MIHPIRWLDEYDKNNPHYVEGVKQVGLKGTIFVILVLGTIMLLVHFFT